ncbi:MAG: phosphoribosylamine--glycine ligase [Deltaproteobacteria bacterium]|nr:phosphoribosylamine--glycine ligase [Deltaproteobacteria bacterium]
MKILVVGSGGREHALVWKLAQSKRVTKIFCAPGNPGIGEIAECVDIGVDDIKGLKEFALNKNIGLTVVGPELPLTLGITDTFEKAGLRLFGPSKAAARLEGSKSFAKKLMKKHGIPTAAYRTFTDAEKAKEYAEKHHPPLVVKADGLAAGKGVLICPAMDEAFLAIDLIMKDRAFGDAGKRVVVEEFLAGHEISLLAISDGETVLPLAPAQDHKPIYDGDEGPNTGGMGAYSPAPISEELQERIVNDVMIPLVRGMKEDGTLYRGVLYVGLMMTGDGPKVLEFNCRFGDPETQPILMRMQSDLLPILLAAVDGKLSKVKIEWDKRTALCAVMASEGYPAEYEKGHEITGLEKVAKMKDVVVFHSGTALEDGRLVTAGGRVLGVTGLGVGIKRAILKTYKAIDEIRWDGAYYRHDIGAKAVK